MSQNIQIGQKVPNFTWKKHVHELTVGSSTAHFLNLDKLGVETVIDPGQHLMSATRWCSSTVLVAALGKYLENMQFRA